nr:hypothetical protein [Bradyrhizobium nanningense]
MAIPAGDLPTCMTVGLVALSIELCAATALAVLDWLGLTTPNLLLAFCFAQRHGGHGALQSSLSEQVPRKLCLRQCVERHQL